MRVKSCPFCASADIHVGSDSGKFWVKCDKCGARGPQLKNKDFMEVFKEIIDKWNDRRGFYL